MATANELATPQHFKIALLRHIARRDAFAGRIDEHGLPEDLAQIQPRVVVQHGVAAYHVLPADRHALAQQRIQLDEHIAHPLPRLLIGGLHPEMGAAAADARAACLGQQIQVQVLRPEKTCRQRGIVKIHRFNVL